MTEDEITKEIQNILEKNGYRMGYKISFPAYRILPDEVRLALSVLTKHSMKIGITIQKKK